MVLHFASCVLCANIVKRVHVGKNLSAELATRNFFRRIMLFCRTRQALPRFLSIFFHGHRHFAWQRGNAHPFKFVDIFLPRPPTTIAIFVFQIPDTATRVILSLCFTDLFPRARKWRRGCPTLTFSVVPRARIFFY